MQLNLNEAINEVRRLSALLDDGLDTLRDQAMAVAAAERDYRKGKSSAWIQIPKGTAKEREAKVDAVTADLRYERDLAEGMRRHALESVRSRSTQISMWQTLLNAHRAEAEFVGKGPR
jgi:hypothetical protein